MTDAKEVASERGPNYEWKHEAEHHKEECDKLRNLLGKVEAQGERDAYERDDLKSQLAQAKQLADANYAKVLELDKERKELKAELKAAQTDLKKIEQMCNCEGNPHQRHCWVMANKAREALRSAQEGGGG